MGRNFIYRRETDTTTRIAREQAKDGAPEGTLILANFQTSGKGRKEGRTWNSEPGLNLLFSILFHKTDVKEALKLSIATPCAVAHSARRVGVNAWTKWPNDVWIGSKKVSGFLADNPEDGIVAIGVGINVNERFESPEREEVEGKSLARSLSDALGHDVSREKFLAHFCNRLEELIELPFNGVLDEYRKFDGLVGKNVIVMPSGKENVKDAYEAEVTGFNEWAHLGVTSNGKQEFLSASEVTIRPQDASIFEANDKVLDKEGEAAKMITGRWRNQLGSEVEFVAKKDGVLEGKYTTAVGNSKHGQLRGGWSDVEDGDGGALMGWTVVWLGVIPNVKPISVCAWSARLYPGEGKEGGKRDEIHSTWVLSSEMSRADQWKHVHVNRDVFTKLSD